MLIECEDCAALVDAQVLKSYVVDTAGGQGPSFRFSFSKCPRCESPFLTVQEEDFPDGWQAPQRLFPHTDAPLAGTIPKPIETAFEEAARCMRAKAYTAAAIMCRKTLEGICAAFNVRERSLLKALEKLRDDGTIEPRLFEWPTSFASLGTRLCTT